MKKLGILFCVVAVCASLKSQEYCSEKAKPLVRDRAYNVNIINEKKAVPYAHIREADVFFEKRIWREIHTQEKMNKTFIYPERPFARILMEAACSGKIRAYSPDDDRFTKEMTQEDVRNYGRSMDTVLTVNPITMEDEWQVFPRELNLDNIKSYRIKEDWIFDKQRSEMVVRILGIAPIESRYDENGNFIADVPMFWFYYPELRNVLVNEEVFNPMNDAQFINWEMIFEMRLFASHITKENNVYDRRIQDYATGVDGLLESERIKNELFIKEHDLWSY